jgi:hypothetical protein
VKTPLRPLLIQPARSFAEAWSAFWFTPADPTVLSFLRVCTGLVLVYVLVATTPLLEPLYGPDGMLPRETMNRLRLDTPWMLPNPGHDEVEPPMVRYRPMVDNEEVFAYRRAWNIDPSVVYARGLPQFSPFFHLTTSRWVLVWHLAGIAVAVLFLLGLWTRVVSVLTWAIALGYCHRASPALFGMDTMMAILLFYLMFAPCGATLSLDRLIERYRDGARALRGHAAPLSPAPGPSVSANVVTRLLQVHFCIIYFASGASKLQGAAWWNGTAIWMTWSNYEFAPPKFEFFTPALQWVAQSRWLLEAIMTGGAAFTLALELGFPFLVWRPRWRPVMLVGAVLLHTGIAVMMGLVAFSLFMMVIAASFIPAQTLKRVLERVFKGPARLWLAYSSRQRVGVRLAAAVHAVDPYGQVALIDAGKPGREGPVDGPLTAPRLGAGDEEGVSGYPLVERLTRSLRVLWPVALLTWLPGASRLGRALAPGEREAREKEAVGAGR